MFWAFDVRLLLDHPRSHRDIETTQGDLKEEYEELLNRHNIHLLQCYLTYFHWGKKEKYTPIVGQRLREGPDKMLIFSFFPFHEF